jgi:hypothetical protein
MLNLRRVWLILTVLLLLAVAERPAEAYVDPGSASYIFQLAMGALLGGIFVVRTYWSRLVTAVRSVVSRGAARTE